jgi:hypothetical protein
MDDGGSSYEHPPEDRLWGADRFVLYLQAAVVALDDIDGSREKGIRNTTEKFLDSPGSTFDKYRGGYIGHIRDLDTKMRAFGTWCQNQQIDCEVCIVHDIYKKRNESAYWRDLEDYDRAGGEYATQFESLTTDTYEKWLRKLRTTDDVLLVE